MIKIVFKKLEPKESLQLQRWHQLVRATFDLFHAAGDSVARILLPKQEMQVRPLGWEEPLEKEMETHTSILAWEVPCTNVPGGLQSMGLQKTWTRHNNLTASNNNHAVGPWAMSKSSCLSAQAPLGLVGARSRGAPRVVF